MDRTGHREDWRAFWRLPSMVLLAVFIAWAVHSSGVLEALRSTPAPRIAPVVPEEDAPRVGSLSGQAEKLRDLMERQKAI